MNYWLFLPISSLFDLSQDAYLSAESVNFLEFDQYVALSTIAEYVIEKSIVKYATHCAECYNVYKNELAVQFLDNNKFWCANFIEKSLSASVILPLSYVT